MRGIVVVLAVSLFVLTTAAPAQVGAPQARATGRVEGVATISSRLTTPRLRVRVYDEPGTPPPKSAVDEHPLAGVVLYLEATDRSTALRGAPAQRPATALELRQHDERFSPHVLPVLAGSTVEFPNDDAVFHNVFSLSKAKTFDLGRYPRGSSKRVTFPGAGVVQVFCHIHADMSGIVLVLDNPFYVVPDAQGRYALDDVPPGDYRLIAWHERIKPMITPVRIEAGRTTTLNLRIPLPDQPAKP